ncbi:MAG: ATP synthase F1 subunit epsilon [Patescibacteria group bacterium]
MRLQIITPAKLVKEVDIDSITLPTDKGQITILPKHQPLLAHLDEGIASYMESGNRVELAIGGGYIQTDGQSVKLLVSRAYGQDEIDEKLTEEAIQRAQKILKEASTKKDKEEARSILRRSIIDSKLIKRRRTSVT